MYKSVETNERIVIIYPKFTEAHIEILKNPLSL